jgi:uncharacterized protein YggE/ABC-type multidrug transport system ATPase subunit
MCCATRTKCGGGSATCCMQDFGVYPRISPQDMLAHIALLKGVTNSRESKEVVEAMLHRCNLYEVRKKALTGYSGGMRQRFGIAQALIGNPHLLIVDEPTAGLDPGERNRFYNLLAEIGEQVIVILSTHIVEDVLDLCSRVAIIHLGKVLFEGRPDDAIATLKGRVWQRSIPKPELSAYEQRYQVISSRLAQPIWSRPVRGSAHSQKKRNARRDRSSRKSSSERESGAASLAPMDRAGNAAVSERKFRREILLMVSGFAGRVQEPICAEMNLLTHTTCMKKAHRSKFLAASIIILTFMAPSGAQAGEQEEKAATLRVHGEATLFVEPDQVELDIGVVTQAGNAKAATDQNSGESRRVVQQLSAEFPSTSIKNINFSVNPNYRYPEGGPAAITGYTANNTVRLLLGDVSRLQSVVDIAIKAGASSINRINFSLRDEASVRWGRALAKAAGQAKSAADALAASLELKLTRLESVEEGQPVIVSPPREITFEKLQSTNLTTISPGAIDVHADVDLTYEIAPAEPNLSPIIALNRSAGLSEPLVTATMNPLGCATASITDAEPADQCHDVS